ncbi:MAG: acetate kinase [Candidatus Zixiibacteriota bacterium]
MNILVLNCGSSSVKYQLIDMEKEFVLAKGLVERIGMSASVLTHIPHDKPQRKISREILDHIQAIDQVIAMLLSKEHGVIADKKEIAAVGHRVVHGGEDFGESVLITKDLMGEIRNLIELAPLHNPHNIRGINAATMNLEDVPQVAVFDTAFHSNMPAHAYIYGIPYQLYKKYSIRRYGFHGPSHQFVSEQAAVKIGKPIKQLKIITCHLGNGASIAAIDKGTSIDTSMGFTPLEGLLMGTRSGDLDPAIILHIMAREELSLHEANTLLNKHSGLYGISGHSSDVREIMEAVDGGNKNAKLAMDAYCYRIKKYIGSYTAAMGGLDAIVFTGGVGENAARVRKQCLEGMDFFGIALDDKVNDTPGKGIRVISDAKSKVSVLVIPTNEELVIARETKRIIEQKKK